MARHFPYQHPLFGRSKNPQSTKSYENSVYYWWYEYLRRNKGYRLTCENGGVGPCSELFNDFGNVHGCDFKTWWKDNDKGAMLFAEQTRHSVMIVDQATSNELFLDENCILLNVNLEIPVTQLLARLKSIISKEIVKKNKTKISSAKYKITGKVDLDFLSKALKVYDAKNENLNKQLWKIANELKLGSSVHWITENEMENKSEVLSDKKNMLAITASRYFKKAKNMIDRTGKGRFPN